MFVLASRARCHFRIPLCLAMLWSTSLGLALDSTVGDPAGHDEDELLEIESCICFGAKTPRWTLDGGLPESADPMRRCLFQVRSSSGETCSNPSSSSLVGSSLSMLAVRFASRSWVRILRKMLAGGLAVCIAVARAVCNSGLSLLLSLPTLSSLSLTLAVMSAAFLVDRRLFPLWLSFPCGVYISSSCAGRGQFGQSSIDARILYTGIGCASIVHVSCIGC